MIRGGSDLGRWPSNLLLDGSEEVLAAFPETQSGDLNRVNGSGDGYGMRGRDGINHAGDSGSAARFFYSAKADSEDRLGSKHPTVKPVDLMRYLCRLVTPPGGRVLDPFAGTGTTGEAAFYEGFYATLIEREAEYQADIRKRMSLVIASTDSRKRAGARPKPIDHNDLFASISEPSRAEPDRLREIRSGRTIGPIGMKR